MQGLKNIDRVLFFLKHTLALFLLSSCTLVNGQNYVKGLINDEMGKPVSFVSVRFAKDSVSIPKAFCISDGNGKYLLSNGKIHAGIIIFSAVGYDEYKLAIHVNDNDTLLVNITLSISSKSLPGITIKNSPSIEISGDTTFYNADRFKRGNESSVGDLVSNIPGFSKGPGGTLVYNGKIIDKVLLNGDDMTGSNYSSLINGLDVQGIENLQVIKNYAAHDNLINSFAGGKEQVLNIAYKKGFLNKLFGTLDGALGTPETYYNTGMQVMGLFDKIKILSINRFNTVGMMNTNPGSSQIPEDIRIDPDNDIDLASRSPIATINDLSTGIEGINPFYKNNSKLSNLNFLIRPAKKLAIRGMANYVNDKYDQQMTSITQYIAQPFFEINKNSNISRRLRKLDGSVSFNYFPNSKNQIYFTVKSAGNKKISTANTILTGSIGNLERTTANNEQTGVKLIYNHLSRSESALSLSIEYKYGALPGMYRVSPAAFQNFFNLTGFNDLFNQQEYQQQTSLFMQSKYIKKKDRHTFTFSTYWKKIQSHSSNLIEAQFLQQNRWVSNDSLNNSKLSWNTTGIIVQDSWLVSKKLSISFSSDFLYYQGRLNNQVSINRHQRIEGVLILPSVNASLKITKKSMLNLSFNSSARFSEPSNSGYGFYVRDITTISKNLDTLQTGAIKSANIFYSHVDLLGKKIVILTGLAFTQIPLLTLGQIVSYQSYAYNQLVSTKKMANNLSLFLSGYKFYSGYRTQLIPSVNFSKGTAYTILQNKITTIDFNQIQIGLGFNTEIRKMQIKSSLQYSIKNQKIVESIANKFLTAISGFSLKLKSNLFADTEFKYFFLKSKNQSSNNYLALSAKIQNNSKNEKWQYGVSGANLLNQNSYSTAVLSEVSAFSTVYQLFPRTVMFFLKYKF